MKPRPIINELIFKHYNFFIVYFKIHNVHLQGIYGYFSCRIPNNLYYSLFFQKYKIIGRVV